MWTALIYAVIAAVLLARGDAKLALGPGTLAAIVAGITASAGLIAFYIALERGEASTRGAAHVGLPRRDARPLGARAAETITPLSGRSWVSVSCCEPN